MQLIVLKRALSGHANILPATTDSFCSIAVSKGALLSTGGSKAPLLTTMGRREGGWGGGLRGKAVGQRRRMVRCTLRILAPCGIGPLGMAAPRLPSADSLASSASTCRGLRLRGSFIM